MTEYNIKLHKIADKSKIERYLITDNNNNKFTLITNYVKCPFGIENNFGNQYRLNISIKSTDNCFNDIIQFITKLEQFISNIDDIKTYKLDSNIINRGSFGYIIKVHLKLIKDKITLTYLLNDEDKSYLDFDKLKPAILYLSVDTFWINHDKKTYGLYIICDKVIQLN